MHVRNRGRNRAFTLVEILIVVVILGILAAIVVPQFTNAANDARSGNIVTQLQTLNNQIELYAARNNGAYPAFDNTDGQNGWSELIDGDYVKDEPASPAWPDAATNTVVETGALGTTGSATAAWVWDTERLCASYFDEDTGEISTVATD
ncbi:MAG TPA: prepilin-type N-terminal cleavage/methylation domain-containing protein [Phycisphaerales bacterium]|nr:prepilin-type N-terminal cleavage/methylation domain-containing protein [Phycisphaerales bacterium]